MFLISHLNPDRPGAWLSLLLLAAALQIHFDAPFGMTGLRGSAADPILILILLVACLKGYWRRVVPGYWHMRGLWYWLAGLTLILFFALLHGRYVMGHWQSWALINKFLGWFILLGFFLLGGLIVSTGKKQDDHFSRMFLVFFWCIALAQVATYIIYKLTGFPENVLWQTQRALGLQLNPNAFGYTAAIAFALLLVRQWKDQTGSSWVEGIGFALIFLCLYLTGSRSAWLGTAMALMIYMVFGGRAFSAVFRGAMITFVLVFTVTSLQAVKQQVFPRAQTATDIYQPPLAGEPVQQKLVAEAQPSYFLGFKIEHFSTIWHRLETSRTAIDMYLRSPLTGTGLGTFLEAESRDYNYQAASPEGPQRMNPVVIHNTLLWLLVEAGPLAAIAFVGFFLKSFLLLARLVAKLTGEGKAYPLAALMILGIFAGVSIGMEAMYNRNLWLILGMAMWNRREAH